MFALLLVGGVVAVLLIKPVVPINSALWEVSSEISETNTEMTGWPELAQQVAGIYAGLPAEQQATTAVLAGNYGEAGALDLYGRELDLPPMISGSNSLWARGYGDPPPETLIIVGFDESYARIHFSDCRAVGRVSNEYGVLNEETKFHNIIYVCGPPRESWAEMWPRMQWFQ